MNLYDLTKLSYAKTRSISPENLSGAAGAGGMCKLEQGTACAAARDLGQGWKVNPYIIIQPKETFEIAHIKGPGIINHIWMTPTGKWRNAILRFYWDGQEDPSVECPVGDFFASGWNEYAQLSSLAVCVNPGSAFNCYWQMPFRSECRITIENRAEEPVTYQFRFGMYRWHLTDPIRFTKKIRVTIQALGWREGGRYLPLQDDIASVAYWYQTIPHRKPCSGMHI